MTVSRNKYVPSPTQIAALKLLAERPMPTTAHSRPGYIAGTTAAALERKGWARWRPGAYEITTSGLLALRQAGGLSKAGEAALRR